MAFLLIFRSLVKVSLCLGHSRHMCSLHILSRLLAARGLRELFTTFKTVVCVAGTLGTWRRRSRIRLVSV